MFKKKYYVMAIALTTLYASIGYSFNTMNDKKMDSKKSCSSNNWHCKNSFYFTGGYVLAHVNYTDHVALLQLPGKDPIPFTTASNYPNNLSGLRIGFGTNLVNNLPFDYEIAYNQLFPKTQTTPNLQITTSVKAITADVSYIFNPQDRFSVRVLVGALAISRFSTFKTLEPNEPSVSATSSGADIDPFVGITFLYHINLHWSAKFVFPYEVTPYVKGTSGAIFPLFMINYYP